MVLILCVRWVGGVLVRGGRRYCCGQFCVSYRLVAGTDWCWVLPVSVDVGAVRRLRFIVEGGVVVLCVDASGGVSGCLTFVNRGCEALHERRAWWGSLLRDVLVYFYSDGLCRGRCKTPPWGRWVGPEGFWVPWFCCARKGVLVGGGLVPLRLVVGLLGVLLVGL